MPKIHVLSGDLTNQIAAGEVVERPASVVKELIENAIDAGARRVRVSIELGGKRLIRVEDDGEGLSAEDARLALERHATSKIRRLADLGAIATLGFRGEALPSIASVSHVTLRTREAAAGAGTEISVQGGAIARIQDCATPQGTIIEVRDLFYNTPARRKFLKSDAAEAGHASRTVTQFALAYPEIAFTFDTNGRTTVQVPAVATFPERLFQLLGERPDLLPFERQGGGMRLFGVAASLGEHGATRGAQNVFVNRRIVRDRTIAHAIAEAYAAASLKERSPEVHLFLELPPERVDVNVHPTKAEVRFLEQSLVHEVVKRALQDVLMTEASLPFRLRAEESGARPPEPTSVPMPGLTIRGSSFAAWQPATPAVGTGAAPIEAATVPAPGTPLQAAAAAAPPRPPGPGLRPMVPLGQFRDTFIVAVDEEGICIIDQHVAHERVLFERVMERLTSGPLESQILLQPLMLELTEAERLALMSHADALRRFGFEVEEFGGATVVVKAMPALLGAGACDAALRALCLDLDGLDRGARVEEAMTRIAASIACHAAVKANDRLTPEKMQYILHELEQTAYSTVCPHGRPVVLRLTRREIEKNFQRV